MRQISFFVYILRTSANTLYVGQTNNLEKRIKEHRDKSSRSAKYIRYFSSFKLVYSEKYATRTKVMQREAQLKRLSKLRKEALIRGDKMALKNYRPARLAKMKKKYYHQKLIRDKIPDKIKTTGDDYKTRVLGKAEFEKELKKKLVEESKELTEAPKEELLNELADVLELTKSIASHYKIPFSKVEGFQEEKRKKRGGFKKKLFLVWSTGKAGK